MKPIVRKNDLLYPELSYIIIGCAFDVYNSLGSGYHEKYYQKALVEAFSEKNVPFQYTNGFYIRIFVPIRYSMMIFILSVQRTAGRLGSGGLW